MTNDTNTIQFGSDAKALEETVETLAAVGADEISGVHLWYDTADGDVREYNADSIHEMLGYVRSGASDGRIAADIVLTVDA